MNDIAYVASYIGLEIFNISRPQNIFPLSTCVTPGSTSSLQVIGDIVYVANYVYGLRVYNVSRPIEPILIGTYSTPSLAVGVNVVGKMAYVADGNAGLLTLDMAQWIYSITPTRAEIGNYQVALIGVNQLGGTSKRHFTIQVQGPPQIHGTIPFQYAKVGQTYYYFIPQDMFADPNNDVIRFAVTATNRTGLLPWLRFSGISATFAGVPSSLDTGNFTLLIRATDDISGAVNTTFGLYVDHAPIQNQFIANQLTAIGLPYFFQLPPGVIIDPDGDPLTYAVQRRDGSGLPDWLSFNADNQTFSGKVTQLGTYDLIIIGSDPYWGQARVEFYLFVYPSLPPQVQRSISDQIATVGESFQFFVPQEVFIDPAGLPLTYSAQQFNQSSLPDWLHFDAPQELFHGTPGHGDTDAFSARDVRNSAFQSLLLLRRGDAFVIQTFLNEKGQDQVSLFL
jgi:large repetitive protein